MLQSQEPRLLDAWRAKLAQAGTRLDQLVDERARERYTRTILAGVLKASELEAPTEGDLAALYAILGEVSRDFADRGLSPSETATFVFSLKEVCFEAYRESMSGDELTARSWRLGTLVDRLGLYTFEAYTLERERRIKSQAEALSDLSTPVIKMWDGIVALPLVGSVDSVRAKDIMEKLLEAVVALEADIVIIDITGVPVVDTQVANRLMRTVEAVRLLGTRSIITGINPTIAQTLVQLGVDLGHLTTKASLAAGLKQAFRELRIKVGERGERT